jgi:hypothetical protein
MSNDAPFFIIGSSRSGTTLLRLILSGHSRLHIPPETWFIRPLVAKFSLTEVLSSAEVDAAVKIVTGDRRWPDMKFPAAEFERQAVQLHQPKLTDLINLVFQRQLVGTGKQRFGDKTPNYFLIVPELATLYPGAKFIHLIRDGRDVAISFVDAGWERYYDSKEFEWTLAMRQQRIYSKMSVANQILEVRYEDLVTDLESNVRKICAFLGETFEPTMLDWTDQKKNIPDRERHIHSKLDQPVSRDAVGTWKKKLSPFECFLIEACLHRDLMQLGYELKFKGALLRPVLALTGSVMAKSAPLLLRGIPYLQRRNYLPKSLYL